MTNYQKDSRRERKRFDLTHLVSLENKRGEEKSASTAEAERKSEKELSKKIIKQNESISGI